MENKIGTSATTRSVFRWISDERLGMLDSYCSDCAKREYTKFDSLDQAFVSLEYPKISDNDREALEHYSGFSHFSLNRAAKGTWSYEDNGNMEMHNTYNQYVEEMCGAIENNQSSIGNVRVYRGVPIKYFREYGISSIDDLEMLNGQYLLDRGFVSTSLVEDECFYRKDPKNGVNYNVMIEYLVPEEFTDGIIMGGVSHYEEEGEYLINVWNMAQVTGVRKESDDRAVVQAMLVPKRVYDESYDIKAELAK